MRWRKKLTSRTRCGGRRLIEVVTVYVQQLENLKAFKGFGERGLTFLSGEKTRYSEYSLCKITDHLSTRDMSFATATMAYVIWCSCFPTNSNTFKRALTDLTPAAYFSLLFVSLPFLRKSQVTSSAVQFDAKYTAEIRLRRII
jgi:hypothetical protein